MSAMIMTFLASVFRKFIFGSSMTWLVSTFKTAGASDADIDKWIQIAIAIGIMAVSAGYSTVKKWWDARNVKPVVEVTPVVK